MKASGAPFGGDGTLDFAFSNLSGKLRGNAATGSGRIILQGEDWTFDKLRFRAGNTGSPSTATSARRARSISISASTPTTWRCWPKARAASCTPRQDRRHVGRAGHQAHARGQRNRARHV